MKPIVFLIRNIAPDCYGGGEEYQVELGQVLKKNGYRPIIFTSSDRLIKKAKDNELEVIKPPYYKMQNWSGWRNILLPIYVVRQLKLKKWYDAQIKKYNPVVLNIQSRDELIGATLAGLKNNKKILWTDHADFRTWSLINVNVKIKNQIGKWILRCAKKVDKIIMINDYEKKSFEKLVKPRRYNNLIVIKNGVIDKYRDFAASSIHRNEFIYIGRVVKEKGVEELISAFKVVEEKYPKAKLNIYGDGDDLENCKRKAEGSDWIKYFGHTEQPLSAISKNEIFVLPSYHEGLSLALLDAAMLGKKIIATDIDGNREVVKNGQTGLLVPVRSIDKLAETMTIMLDDKNRANKMSKSVRDYYKQKFDLEKIFDSKMKTLYEVEK